MVSFTHFLVVLFFFVSLSLSLRASSTPTSFPDRPSSTPTDHIYRSTSTPTSSRVIRSSNSRTPSPSAVRPASRTPSPSAVRPASRTPSPSAVRPASRTPSASAIRPASRTPSPSAVRPASPSPSPSVVRPASLTPSASAIPPYSGTPIPMSFSPTPAPIGALPNVQTLGVGFDAKQGQPVVQSQKSQVVFLSFAFGNLLPVSGGKYVIPDQAVGKVISTIDSNPEAQVFTSVNAIEQGLFNDLTTGFSDQYISGMFSDSKVALSYTSCNQTINCVIGFTNQRVKSWVISLVGLINSTQTFFNAVSYLPSELNSANCQQFQSFIDQFGTHYLNKILFGGSISMTSVFSYQIYSERGSEVNQDLETLFSLLTYPGTLSYQQQQQLEQLESIYLSKISFVGGYPSNYQPNQWKEWSTTVPLKPIPVSMDLQLITKLFPPQFSYKISAMQSAIDSYLASQDGTGWC